MVGLFIHKYPALMLLNYAAGPTTYIVPAPCKLSLKAAGINHHLPAVLIILPSDIISLSDSSELFMLWGEAHFI